ncbi:hypothetical protein EFBL_2394 [Effusibacillus lacus]|uniref:Uncharacterized protein n=1 Tax=Effusibacillus lacus TaxID=1348429 RepID=A0A292YPQ9_9BACL|nr:hypothetical protein EDD64_12855 [Effusibacillus lacus]GAX90753.1 hypothetical protein EFBL_2394 [Effusibacillus lacus]
MNAQQLNEAILKHIRPDTFPVGIKIVKSETDLPPASETGHGD